MSNLLTAEIVKALNAPTGRNLIITAGNCARGDDGVGPYIAEKLQGLKTLRVIDAGFTPENIVEDVIEMGPDNILIIDAADFGGCAGEVRLISEDSIPETTLSTHAIPLSVIAGIIVDSIDAEISYVGIQVKTVAFSDKISEEVKISANSIIEILKHNYSYQEA